MKLRFTMLTGMAVLLIGCASTEPDPYRDAQRINPKRVKLTNQSLVHELSYLAQAMMESDQRQKAVKNLLEDIEADPAAYTFKTKSKKQNNTSYAMQAKAGTDVLVGQLGSGLGMKVGAVVAVSELLYNSYQMFRDDSMDLTSQALLPATYNGVDLKTAEQAQQALISFTDSQIMSIASNNGWQAQCIDGCGTPQSSYFISLKEAKNPGYAYFPQDMVIVVDIGDVIELPTPNLVSLATHTPLKWATKLGNTYLINTYSGLIYDKDGKVELRYSEKFKRNFPAATDPLVDTPLGRDLAAKLHSTPYTYFGTQNAYPDQFIYRGKKYNFTSNSTPNMIRHELQEPNLLK